MTLLFDKKHLTVTIGLTLTVMLVMYTMYQGILGALTPTAYLKMLDYWLLFCLLTPFLVFTIEVHWLLKSSRSESVSKKWHKKVLDSFLSQQFMKIFVPVATFMFVVSYIFAAILISNNVYLY